MDKGPAGREQRVGDLLARLAAWQSVPAPYAAGTHQLWTDPEVGPGMLRAHLDPEHDVASRRPATIDTSVAWLAARLPPGARVLDLGCGPGLYTERLAAAGFAATGIDLAPGSIDHARSHQSGVRYLLGDYREITLDETFDAVLLIYLDYGALSPADGLTVLRRVRHWLAPGGTFVFDVAAPAHRDGSERRRDWGVAADGFWTSRPHAWLTRTLRYPAERAYLDEHIVVTADDVRLYRVWERCFTEATIRAELVAADLTIRAVYADLTGSPYTEGASPQLTVLAGRSVGTG